MKIAKSVLGVVSMAVAAVAAAECYDHDGLTFCCVSTTFRCSVPGVGIWNCPLTSNNGGCNTLTVTLANGPGFEDVIITLKCACTMTLTKCGPVKNSCIPDGSTSLTCYDNQATGDPCTGGGPGEP